MLAALLASRSVSVSVFLRLTMLRLGIAIEPASGHLVVIRWSFNVASALVW